MRCLFVDTAGWVACADEADPVHSGAVAARDQWLENGGLLITTDYIVDETLTFCGCDWASAPPKPGGLKLKQAQDCVGSSSDRSAPMLRVPFFFVIATRISLSPTAQA